MDSNERVLLQENVFSYKRMCSLTIDATRAPPAARDLHPAFFPPCFSPCLAVRLCVRLCVHLYTDATECILSL